MNKEYAMTRWLVSSILLSALAIAPASAQTTTQKPAAPTSKPAAPSTQKPAAPSTQKPATEKPAAPAETTAKPAAPAASAAKHGPGVYAHITTNHGAMIARLFDKEVPRTVENFVGLAEGKKQWKNPRTGTMVRRPYYNNLTFHRIIPNFMIQGGDPEGTGMGGPGFTFADEFNPKLRHSKAGILSMANSGPNTNGGQFFITLAPTPWLDNRHSVFGEIVEGMDVLTALGNVPTNGKGGNPPNKPLKPVIMKSVRIERVS
jgi:peptidyl-prolyl cis-trans isomerase A (cyclophilin A)